MLNGPPIAPVAGDLTLSPSPGARNGLTVQQASHADVAGNLIDGNAQQGIRVAGNSGVNLADSAMLLFTRATTGLAPRSHVLAIAGGLAFYAFIFLLLQAIRLWGTGQPSPHGSGQLSYFRYWMRASAAGAYFAVVVFWIFSLWFDDRPASPAPELIEA